MRVTLFPCGPAANESELKAFEHLKSRLQSTPGNDEWVLLANLAYTFGPLHFYHFSQPSPWPMLAAIFAIGLIFAVLLHRSRNLWMVAVFHGIGTAWILG